MSRPSVLVVDPEASRRRELARGLSGFGYEVIPAVDAQEGKRFAEGLGPGIVVRPSGDRRGRRRLPPRPLRLPVPNGHTLLLLGKSEEEGRELPQEVLFLVADGLPGDDLVRRIHLVLLGREIGVEPDSGVESLVGDFSLVPPLELLRALHRARLDRPAGLGRGRDRARRGRGHRGLRRPGAGNQGLPPAEPPGRGAFLGAAPETRPRRRTARSGRI